VIAPLVLAAVAVLAPARVQVTAQEYTLTLSRPAIKAGPAIIELANFGEDTHDLRIKQLGVKKAKTFGVAALPPGETGDVERKLVVGRYQLWCSIADHRTRGMRAVLLVKK
jgi:hypothetical protein